MAFNLLPVEVNSTIAEHLSDKDIASFSLTCHNTHSAISCDRSPLWRAKFIQYFDLVPGTSNNTLKSIYQWRRRLFRGGAHFQAGKTTREQQCLLMLRDLILESYASGALSTDADGNPVSKNLKTLKRFAANTDFFRNIASGAQMKRQTALFQTIQIVLSHLRFDSIYHGLALGWEDTQKAMYATADTEPLFRGKNLTEVNLAWILRCVNFFKGHFASDENPEMRQEYSSLVDFEKIHAWRRPLKNGVQRLGSQWCGAYSYLDQHELESIRSTDDTQVFLDNFNASDDGCYPMQTLRLDWSKISDSRLWPKMFERHLRSLSHPSAKHLSSDPKSQQDGKRTTRAQHRHEPPATSHIESRASTERIDPKPVSFSFQGSGQDGDKFFAAGWLNPLPPQNGIPGWMRFTMMKFFVDGEDSDKNDEADPFLMSGMKNANPFECMDTKALWAYEGVVLPGGEIVVGRWWSPQDEDSEDEELYSGPFIFWCTDPSPTEA